MQSVVKKCGRLPRCLCLEECFKSSRTPPPLLVIAVPRTEPNLYEICNEHPANIKRQIRVDQKPTTHFAVSRTMSKSIVNTVPYPFQFQNSIVSKSSGRSGQTRDVSLTLPNVRGRTPSLQASRLRTMMLEAHNDPTKILAHCCSYDGLSSRLVEEAGFPMVFLAGYAVASGYGLPDTGYIAMQEMCDKIQDAVRQVQVPVMADGDTGYGSPMNVKRTVER